MAKATRRKMRPMTSAELGRWGEMRFAAMCAEARLVPQRPDYDLNGWDFLVEFPHLEAEVDTDIAGRQQPLQCFVQVKTVWEGRKEVELGLSAAARLGKAPLPSFLCILEASEAPNVIRLHVLHMMGPLLERVLRKLRGMQAKRQTTLINKTGFRVPVPKVSESLQPTGNALLCAMEKAVGPDHVACRREKETFLRTAGFPTARMTGTFSIRAESDAEYSDFRLGLKPLPVVDFKAVETRWGISLPLKLDGVPVSVTAIPKPEEVEVVWRRVGAFGTVRLKMQAVAASGSDGAGIDRWLLTHPNLELRIDGNSYSMRMIGPDKVRTGYRTLVQLHALEELLTSDSPVDVQLLVRGKLMMAWRPEGALELRPREINVALGEVLQQLGFVLSSAGLQDIQLPGGSWIEWREDLWRLFSILQTPDGITLSVTLKVPESRAIETEEHETLYVTALEFDDQFLAYYSTCRGRVELEGLPRQWRFHASEFVVRDLRLLEKSDGAMHAFAEEAKAVTGLTTTILTWGTLPGLPEPSESE